ncbi:MAG: hypothetical protein KDA44_19950, partial [Planctomycetales bacterium]|nr:hypothetical protein [Planctomycetales bacterium]
GGAGRDTLRGQSGDDWMYGGSGDDKLIGGTGIDILEGGAGDDRVYGGKGNDQFLYVMAANTGASDEYHGNKGFDTLVLNLSRDEWFQADVQADIQAYLAFLAAHTDPATEQADGETFQFTAFDLKARQF